MENSVSFSMQEQLDIISFDSISLLDHIWNG